ncbi:MAG: hypothetical protein ACJ764_02685 [Solirubrobacteraceae bacterium]
MGARSARRYARSSVVIALIAVVIAAVGFARAAIPGNDGVIHACYATGGSVPGQLRVIDEQQTCPAGEAALDWPALGRTGPIGGRGHVGPVGSTGPTGSRGLQGRRGPTGPRGEAGFTYPREYSGTIVGRYGRWGYYELLGQCPPGDKLLSGGAELNAHDYPVSDEAYGDLHLKASYPVLASQGWKAVAAILPGDRAPVVDWTIVIHLHCWKTR